MKFWNNSLIKYRLHSVNGIYMNVKECVKFKYLALVMI